METHHRIDYSKLGCGEALRLSGWRALLGRERRSLGGFLAPRPLSETRVATHEIRAQSRAALDEHRGNWEARGFHSPVWHQPRPDPLLSGVGGSLSLLHSSKELACRLLHLENQGRSRILASFASRTCEGLILVTQNIPWPFRSAPGVELVVRRGASPEELLIAHLRRIDRARRAGPLETLEDFEDFEALSLDFDTRCFESLLERGVLVAMTAHEALESHAPRTNRSTRLGPRVLFELEGEAPEWTAVLQEGDRTARWKICLEDHSDPGQLAGSFFRLPGSDDDLLLDLLSNSFGVERPAPSEEEIAELSFRAEVLGHDAESGPKESGPLASLRNEGWMVAELRLGRTGDRGQCWLWLSTRLRQGELAPPESGGAEGVVEDFARLLSTRSVTA